MYWSSSKRPRSSAILCVTALIITAAFLFYASTLNETAAIAGSAPAHALFAAPSATFAADAPSLGAIPDHVTGCDATGATPRNVTFTVSGLSGSVSTVELSNLTFGAPAHTWMGDIEAVLIAPNGASHTVFGRTLATTATSCGDATDLTGPYAFSDSAAAPPNGGWWQTSNILGTTVPMTVGTYRTTGIGGAGATIPMPPTNMNPAFTGVANANGTWTLRLSDHGGGDTGAVSAATLTVTTGAVVPVDANVDMNGDGKTDYVVARGTSTPLTEAGASTIAHGNYSALDERPAKGARTPASAVPQAPPIYWYTALNGSGTTSVAQLGDAATDFITPEDFDGDGKDDIAVWTEAAATVANFKILRSSTMTVDTQIFGQTGDDPAVVGDYDGDNKADPAVYRCPGIADPDGQCYFFYRGSNANPSGNITYVPWGFGVDGDFFPYVGDFDGDGKNDFCIQGANPSSPTNGLFQMLKSGGGTEGFIWGLSSDFLIPGDYDGDGKTDICVRRTVGGLRNHYVLTRTGAVIQQQWGVTGDSSVPGDYDGDGKTDFAIWRPNADPTQNYFWVLNSGTGATSVLEWGQCNTVSTCDFAVAGWAVH